MSIVKESIHSEISIACLLTCKSQFAHLGYSCISFSREGKSMTLPSIEKLREDTPGCQHVLHFNNAGASLPTRGTVKSVIEHLNLEATIGGYEAAAQTSSQTEKFYDHAARLINCDKDEIAFAENATRAWDMAFYSLKFKKGDCIITSTHEYASNYLAFLQTAKDKGAEIRIVENDANGEVDLTDLQNKLDSKVKLIAITHVPTQSGLINPAEDIGRIAKSAKILYLLDATQSVGQMPIDVKAINCDFLCATGRKYLRAPRGTGFLYARKSILEECEPPFIDLHAATWTAENKYEWRSDAKRFETWEQNIAAKIGLGTAIEYALTLGLPATWERIKYLATLLRKQLSQNKNIHLQDLGKHQCGIVTFTYKAKSAADVQQYLAQQKINVSVSLQEYARLDLAERNLPALIRASVHYYNNEDEIERFCAALRLLS